MFDHNTCRGIGIGVDELGNLEGEQDGSVHFEAMTAEMWGERERERERQYTTEAPEEAPEVVEEVVPSMRLTFKSKGYEDFRLKVRPVCFVLSSHSLLLPFTPFYSLLVRSGRQVLTTYRIPKSRKSSVRSETQEGLGRSRRLH